MLTNKPAPNVAVIHDWLTGYRGGERVLEAICELYPQAEIFTLFHTPGAAGPRLGKHRIHVSFLDAIPGARRFYKHLLPLFPMAIERFDLSAFELVISSSHCVAKGVIPPPRARHLCYCHTTMRYVWDQYGAYFCGWREKAIFPFSHYLRMWDVTSSARVDHFVANSQFVAERIKKYYRREATVINPFVDLETYRPTAGDRGDYYLFVSALVPYKRLDLAVRACRQLGRKLLVVGQGSEKKKAQRLGGKEVQFLGSLEAAALRDLYAGARALLFPGEEDFGIAPLEAMACGTPIIAFGRGGATETVVEGETGLFFEAQTVESLVDAIQRFERGTAFSAARCRARAEKFSKAEFQRNFARALAAGGESPIPPSPSARDFAV